MNFEIFYSHHVNVSKSACKHSNMTFSATPLKGHESVRPFIISAKT